MTPDNTRGAGILAAAVTLARETHYHRVSRADVAQRAGCGAGTVNLYFGDMEGLRDAVVAEAVRLGDTDIIAQAIVAKHPAVAGKRVQVVG
jgi:AcrR family transcriptional regulator